MMQSPIRPPTSEAELLERCQTLAGLSFAQLASLLNISIPDKAPQRKGWVGHAIELALGANAGNLSMPDFMDIGVELKTVPINHLGKPAESTFVTTIPLLTIHQQNWQTSQCLAKLRRVLWLPIEGDVSIPFQYRRIGCGVLWSPSIHEEQILARDWSEHTLLIATGRLTEIDASMGEYLQIRPKAASAKSLCLSFDDEGNQILTLPRGFYLRSSFTGQLLGYT